MFQGYATAWCEEGNILSMVLLKYFDKELKEEWHREANIVQGLSCDEEPHANLLHYRWHSKGKQPSSKKKKILSYSLRTKILTVIILTSPCPYKVPDGGKALHLLKANHNLFATKLFRPQRRHLQSHGGGEGSLCSLESL